VLLQLKSTIYLLLDEIEGYEKLGLGNEINNVLKNMKAYASGN
jgi:hypothetical protein